MSVYRTIGPLVYLLIYFIVCFVVVCFQNTNITRVEVGPQTVVLESNERLIGGPFPMIVIPPAHYCVIKNPMS